MTRRAVFVDRDGTINQLVPDSVSGHPESPLEAADVALISGAAGALSRLAGAGWLLVGVSNQPAAAKLTATIADLQAVQARVVELLEAEGVKLDDFRLCFHHPDGRDPALTRRCPCRKPEPGMLFAAATDLHLDLSSSWMIGDTDADVIAGRRAGCRSLLLETPGSAHKRCGSAPSDATATDLGAAADLILAGHAGT